jgi:metal-responsive CopG/Arc/MetJ family transcriptional regulator
MYMKAIQVTFDEKLLAHLDRDKEVRRDGRSAVLRRAAAEYLRRARRSEISEAYRQAYATRGDHGDELRDWEGQGVWPND